MMPDIQKRLVAYEKWLKDKTQVRQIRDAWVEVTTPHLDRNNDYLQIYIKKEDDTYVMTDDGYIINDLEMSGCNLDSAKREDILRITLAGFGVQRVGNQLQTHAIESNFPFKKHSLLQAMLTVNDMFFLSSPHIMSLFYDDVVKWLDISEIRYTPRANFSGKSGYNHIFDFVIPKSKRQPERLVQAINSPKKDAVESLFFKWIDTKEARPHGSQLFAFLNDTQSAVVRPVEEAMKSYGILPVRWSQREEVEERLVA